MFALHSLIQDDVFDDAACREASTDVFFPPTKATYAEARPLCAACPLATKQTCLDLAMRAEDGSGASNRYGMFGGLTPTERADLARERDSR